MDFFTMISKVPGLEPYFAAGIYVVLRKPLADLSEGSPAQEKPA
jgi:hypothetical protein